MEPPVVALALIFLLSGCAASGGLVAGAKRRSPMEGLFLGLFLGPIGVAIEASRPAPPRSAVDEGVRSSFHSLVSYQSTMDRPGRARP